MFKYIDNKTERSVEATIKTLATKDELNIAVAGLKDNISTVRSDLTKQIGESRADIIKWMFVFWIGQVAATLAIIFLYVKK